jgi:transposase
MLQAVYGDFFPKTYTVRQRLGTGDGCGYVFELLSDSRSAFCASCGTESIRAHSYQDRTVRDLPILGESVTLLLSQRRYFCGNAECAVEIFTEQTGFVNPYFQFTERCREYMLKVASLVSCEGAVKILAYQGIKVCGDTLLNMLKAAGKTLTRKPGRTIGVDDWAYRKGQRYGTLICDLETHDVIDVLADRERETFESWLRGHPGIEIVSRDRSRSYAGAVTGALPQAVQIADRFHITKNLLDALNDTMKAFMPEVVEIPSDEPVEDNAADTNLLVKKTRRRTDAKPRK